MSNDTLASWRAGKAKQAILDFIKDVTTQGGPDFVPPPEQTNTRNPLSCNRANSSSMGR